MHRTLFALAVLAMAGPSLAYADQTTGTPATVSKTDGASGDALAAEAAATTDASASPGALRDPWEKVNRKVFAFNTAVDAAVLEPVAKGYRKVTPRFARTGVSNLLSNLRAPVTVANDLLQGDGRRASVTAARFGLNSTIGVAGLFDVADGMGLEQHEEDFGQTLGVWGVKPGIYLMLPLMGPSTARDLTGSIVDTAFHPLTYAQGEDAGAVRGGLVALGVISAREAAIEAVNDLRVNSSDPYVTVRSVYGQSRESAIRNGRQNVEDLPDFGGPP